MNVILGYIAPDYFLGGEIALREDLARGAVEALGARLGMGVPETAQAVFGVVNNMIAGYITTLCTKRGYDTRDFALLAGGGAGGVHGAWIAEELDIERVIVPRHAAAYSAFGMFTMQIGWEFARSYVTRAGGLDLKKLKELYGEMEAEARATLRWLHVAPQDIIFVRSAEMRYVGQYHEVETGLAAGPVNDATLAACLEAFHRKHDDMYAFAMPDQPVEFLTFRLRASVDQRAVVLRGEGSQGVRPPGAPKRRRPCLFRGKAVDTPIYDGGSLRAGHQFQGPAVIEERNTTIVVPETFRCAVDPIGNYLLTRSR